MAAKTHADPPAKSRHARRREIGGILLLAGGLFTGLSLLSMHVGGDPLMGPGGDALASGTYGLVGADGLSLHRGRFSSRRCVASAAGRSSTGSARRWASLSFWARSPRCSTCRSLTARSPCTVRGDSWARRWPRRSAPSSAPVGAALAATTMLVVSVLMVTDISTREATVVVAWALRHAAHGIAVGARAAWRVTRAAFPEKDDTGERGRRRDADDEPETAHADDGHDDQDEDDSDDRIAIVEPIRAVAEEEEAGTRARRAGRERGGARRRASNRPRRRFAPAGGDGGDRRGDGGGRAAGGSGRGRGRGGGRGRGRRRGREDGGGRGSAGAASGRADHRRVRFAGEAADGRGGSGDHRRGARRQDGGGEARLHQAGRWRVPDAGHRAARVHPAARRPRSTSSSSTTWPSGWSRRCPTTACAGR